jgi:thioesterase domain-containing protein
MAADYLALIRSICPSGPYNLLGWSFGGPVAHAIATQLQADGKQVGVLAILDGFPREPGRPPRDALDDIADADDTLKITFEALRSDGYVQSPLGERHYAIIRDNMRKSDLLLSRFRPVRFNGDAHLFVAMEKNEEVPIDAWRPCVEGQLEVHYIEGTHAAMMEPAAAAKIGRVLTSELLKQKPVIIPPANDEYQVSRERQIQRLR